MKLLEETNKALLQRLEASEARHAKEVAELKQKLDAMGQERAKEPAEWRSPGGAPGSSGWGVRGLGERLPPEDPTKPTLGSRVGGAEAKGKAATPSVPLKPGLRNGFELYDEDGEYSLQVHQETQIEYRQFYPVPEDPVRSGFYIPRARFFLTGRVTKPIEYTLSFNKGFGAFDLLDGFVNFNFDERLQFRAGRFMTPWNYEQYQIPNMWLPSTERSLMTANVGLNRQVGAMFWGKGWDGRLDHAVGVFNGPRNSYEDQNNGKDVMAYLNIRPFEKQEDAFLRFLNVGGSYTYGDQNNVNFLPRAFRTATNATNAGVAENAAPPFLTFNRDVVERGERMFWSTWIAFYRKQLTLLAFYDGGRVSYAPAFTAPGVTLPVNGYSLQMAYFLTGEEIERRSVVKPKRNFDLRPGKRGLGAWEISARYNTFNIDREVFEAGLSNPAEWSNDAWSTDVGFNWYWNPYIKWYFLWHHSEFGNPVFYNSEDGARSLTNELFWVRCQIFF